MFSTRNPIASFALKHQQQQQQQVPQSPTSSQQQHQVALPTSELRQEQSQKLYQAVENGDISSAVHMLDRGYPVWCEGSTRNTLRQSNGNNKKTLRRVVQSETV